MCNSSLIKLRYTMLYRRLSANTIKRYCSSTVVKWTSPSGIETDFQIDSHITKCKLPFTYKSKHFITWYACGPTVYDYAHIGHACSFVKLDIIRRILEKYLNTPIIQAMSVTDIDDKIIRRAKETNTDWKVLTNIYEKEFFADMASLNVKKPTIVGRATNYIPQMVNFIQRLISKEFAYVVADGSVYFDLKRYGKEGKFRTDCVEDYSHTGSVQKRNRMDFALWKAAKSEEPYWEAPWGKGKPGWHIECSTIASEYFGNSVDIHSGGFDLMFPHHQNEDTQCCVYHDVDQWVSYWLHTGFLHLSAQTEKMSKSLQNTISVGEFLRTYSPNHLRMMCFATHYRANIEYTEELLDKCIKKCAKFYNFFEDCLSYINGYSAKGNIDSSKLLQVLENTKVKVDNALKDDFDTVNCSVALLELLTETSGMLHAKPGNRCPVSVALVYTYVHNLMTTFGFNISEKRISGETEGEHYEKLVKVVNSSVNFRDQVREIALSNIRKDAVNKSVYSDLLKFGDNFRKELQYQDIIVKDRKTGSAWSFADEKKKNR